MTYFWEVVINGNRHVMKAVKAHTAVGYALKYEKIQLEGTISFKRGRVVAKIQCPKCLRRYDEDKQSCPNWKCVEEAKEAVKLEHDDSGRDTE
jgi:hypothetical protein